MTDYPRRTPPRTRADLRAKLAEVERLVWYSRHRTRTLGAETPADIRDGAEREARAGPTDLASALARVDLDVPWQVARLEGQQAALRWALDSGYEELLPHGELYDS